MAEGEDADVRQDLNVTFSNLALEDPQRTFRRRQCGRSAWEIARALPTTTHTLDSPASTQCRPTPLSSNVNPIYVPTSTATDPDLWETREIQYHRTVERREYHEKRVNYKSLGKGVGRFADGTLYRVVDDKILEEEEEESATNTEAEFARSMKEMSLRANAAKTVITRAKARTLDASSLSGQRVTRMSARVAERTEHSVGEELVAARPLPRNSLYSTRTTDKDCHWPFGETHRSRSPSQLSENSHIQQNFSPSLILHTPSKLSLDQDSQPWLLQRIDNCITEEGHGGANFGHINICSLPDGMVVFADRTSTTSSQPGATKNRTNVSWMTRTRVATVNTESFPRRVDYLSQSVSLAFSELACTLPQLFEAKNAPDQVEACVVHRVKRRLLLDLPYELLSNIVSYVSPDPTCAKRTAAAVGSLRLANRSLGNTILDIVIDINRAYPELNNAFGRLRVEVTSHSLDMVSAISSNEKLAENIRELVIVGFDFVYTMSQASLRQGELWGRETFAENGPMRDKLSKGIKSMSRVQGACFAARLDHERFLGSRGTGRYALELNAAFLRLTQLSRLTFHRDSMHHDLDWKPKRRRRGPAHDTSEDDRADQDAKFDMGYPRRSPTYWDAWFRVAKILDSMERSWSAVNFRNIVPDLAHSATEDRALMNSLIQKTMSVTLDCLPDWGARPQCSTRTVWNPTARTTEWMCWKEMLYYGQNSPFSVTISVSHNRWKPHLWGCFLAEQLMATVRSWRNMEQLSIIRLPLSPAIFNIFGLKRLEVQHCRSVKPFYHQGLAIGLAARPLLAAELSALGLNDDTTPQPQSWLKCLTQLFRIWTLESIDFRAAPGEIPDIPAAHLQHFLSQGAGDVIQLGETFERVMSMHVSPLRETLEEWRIAGGPPQGYVAAFAYDIVSVACKCVADVVEIFRNPAAAGFQSP